MARLGTKVYKRDKALDPLPCYEFALTLRDRCLGQAKRTQLPKPAVLRDDAMLVLGIAASIGIAHIEHMVCSTGCDG